MVALKLKKKRFMNYLKHKLIRKIVKNAQQTIVNHETKFQCDIILLSGLVIHGAVCGDDQVVSPLGIIT
jgi:hypothetical protein